jgi:hypothetical protein
VSCGRTSIAIDLLRELHVIAAEVGALKALSLRHDDVAAIETERNLSTPLH